MPTREARIVMPHTKEAITTYPVLIVEDNRDMQARLGRILSGLGVPQHAISYAASLAEAQVFLAREVYALALIDIILPDGNGIDLIMHAQKFHVKLPCVVVTPWNTENYIVGALRAGAIGYLLAERDDVEFRSALQSIGSGGSPIDPFVASHILDIVKLGTSHKVPSPDNSESPSLTPREHVILKLVAEGLSNREISEKINLSKMTVECHIKHIYQKLSVHSRIQAVNQAHTFGLLH